MYGLLIELGCFLVLEVSCLGLEVVLVLVGVVCWIGVGVKVCEVCGVDCVVVCDGEVIGVLLIWMGV